MAKFNIFKAYNHTIIDLTGDYIAVRRIREGEKEKNRRRIQSLQS